MPLSFSKLTQPQQTTYMKAVYAAAQQKALDAKDPIFDAQGAMMVELTPDEIKLPAGFPNIDNTLNTTVTLDINHIPALADKFKKVLSLEEKEYNEFRGVPKGSITPIYRVMYFNLLYAKNVYQSILDRKDILIDAALAQMKDEINTTIKNAVQYAHQQNPQFDKNNPQQYINDLNKALANGVTNIDGTWQINEAKDAELYRLCQEAQNCLKASLSEEENEAIKKAKLKPIVNKTNATPNDLVFFGETQANWSSGNAVSSHDRKLCKTLAEAQKAIAIQESVNFELNTQDPDNIAIESYDAPDQTISRVPSPSSKIESPLRFGLQYLFFPFYKFYVDVINPNAYILDSKLKLQAIKIATAPNDTMVYNLLTALHGADEIKNQQSESAKFLLLGAHALNAEIPKNGNIFIQNISVNGFGNPLGYSGWYKNDNYRPKLTSLDNETTLMAEMALMDTLKEDKGQNTQYDTFLANRKNNSYFYDSKEGRAARVAIQIFKNSCVSEAVEVSAEATPQDIARAALKKMMANDAHFTNRGALIQAISLIVQKKSAVGCKSAIDRTPMVKERFDLLQAELNNSNSKVRENFIALTQTTSAEEFTRRMNSLENAVDTEVNKKVLNTQACNQTCAESGGLPKYQTKTGTWKDYFDTNKAENSNISAWIPGKTTQGHKAMVKMMQKAQSQNMVKKVDEVVAVPASKEIIEGGSAPVGSSDVKLVNELGPRHVSANHIVEPNHVSIHKTIQIHTDNKNVESESVENKP